MSSSKNIWCSIQKLRIQRDKSNRQSPTVHPDNTFVEVPAAMVSDNQIGKYQWRYATTYCIILVRINPQKWKQNATFKAKRVTIKEAEDESHFLTPVNDFKRQSNTVFDSILIQLQSKISLDFNLLSGESFSSLFI